MQREERAMDTKNLRNPEYMKRWFDQVGFQAADEIEKLTAEKEALELRMCCDLRAANDIIDELKKENERLKEG